MYEVTAGYYSRYEGVVSVTVRRKAAEDGAHRSWALVSFEAVAGAGAVVARLHGPLVATDEDGRAVHRPPAPAPRRQLCSLRLRGPPRWRAVRTPPAGAVQGEDEPDPRAAGTDRRRAADDSALAHREHAGEPGGLPGQPWAGRSRLSLRLVLSYIRLTCSTTITAMTVSCISGHAQWRWSRDDRLAHGCTSVHNQM
jgi:hypothetical protein